LVYDKSFWPEDINDIILLNTEKEQSIELSESLKNILNNEKIDAQIIKTIIEAIHRYDVLPSTDVPVLISWFGGPAALLIEDLSEIIIGQICHEILCHYLDIPLELNQPIRIIKSE
jgi:hypothetical protein